MRGGRSVITGPGRIVQWFDAEGRPIEIGQKRDNMKKFNLEEALQGKPVVTRDGRKVGRIVHLDGISDVYSVLTVIDGDLERYTKEGKFLNGSSGPHSYDLFMESAKKEGWVNIYDKEKAGLGNQIKGRLTGENIYNNEECARKAAVPGLIATVRIEWEE